MRISPSLLQRTTRATADTAAEISCNESHRPQPSPKNHSPAAHILFRNRVTYYIRLHDSGKCACGGYLGGRRGGRRRLDVFGKRENGFAEHFCSNVRV